MESKPKPKSARQLRKEREQGNRELETPDPLTVEAARFWSGWEQRGKRERYCLT